MKEKRKERKGKKLDNEPIEEKRGIAMQIAFKPVLSGSARGMVGWPLDKKRKKLAHSAQLSVSLMFLPNFDVLCDQLLNRATVT